MTPSTTGCVAGTVERMGGPLRIGIVVLDEVRSGEDLDDEAVVGGFVGDVPVDIVGGVVAPFLARGGDAEDVLAGGEAVGFETTVCVGGCVDGGGGEVVGAAGERCCCG